MTDAKVGPPQTCMLLPSSWVFFPLLHKWSDVRSSIRFAQQAGCRVFSTGDDAGEIVLHVCRFAAYTLAGDPDLPERLFAMCVYRTQKPKQSVWVPLSISQGDILRMKVTDDVLDVLAGFAFIKRLLALSRTRLDMQLCKAAVSGDASMIANAYEVVGEEVHFRSMTICFGFVQDRVSDTGDVRSCS